ncbi:MAG: hypothetical protein J6U01_02850 [Clostridia bacterium]|nr:hypothetical protein [Clostridia bacterium]
MIGLALYFRMKKRNTMKEEAAQKDNVGAVDGVEVEQIIAPEHMYRSND